MSTTSAAHTRVKPAQRAGGIDSWKTAMPIRNWNTGARYWSSPSTLSGTRTAAVPKSSSGTAVITPLSSSSPVWPQPYSPGTVWPKVPRWATSRYTR